MARARSLPKISTASPKSSVPSKRFKVREATTEDVDVLVRQRHMMMEDMRPRTEEEHLIGDTSYRKWALQKIRKRLLHCFIVTDRKGKVAGGGGVWLREVQPSAGHPAHLSPYLMSVYTEPKFRRKGVATLIVKAAEGWARGQGYARMNLHASRQGRKVYSALGWKRTWEMQTELTH